MDRITNEQREAIVRRAIADRDALLAAGDFNAKTERNARVQGRYDELMREGKHGHYETMFRVVHEEVGRSLRAASPVAPVGAPTRLSNQQVRKLMQVAHKWAGPDENDSRSDILEMALRELRFVRQGCELATDATKQPDLLELAKVYSSIYASPHHITFTLSGLKALLSHLAAPQNDQDIRRRPASSEAAPSAEEPGPLIRPNELNFPKTCAMCGGPWFINHECKKDAT